MQGLDLIYSTLKLLKMIHDDPMSNGATLLPVDHDTNRDLAYVKNKEMVDLGPATYEQLCHAIKECEAVSEKVRGFSDDAADGDGPDTELFLEKINKELSEIAIPQETIDNLAE